MGKASKVKREFADVIEMVDLIQTLKDIADNKFFTLTAKKDSFRRFGETFVEFFRMISLSSIDHPLIKNDCPVTGIVVLTIEGGFLGRFNNQIIRMALQEREKHEQSRFIAIGEKSVEQLSRHTSDLKVFSGMEGMGFYEMAVIVKDYLVDEVMSGKLGKVIICYSWPKSFEIQKPRKQKLLPCDDLLVKQAEFVDEFENIIEESDPVNIIGYLSNIWITTRLYEIFIDTTIASAAAQSSFLEDSVDKMKKERTKTAMRYRKAKKGDIDKSLRETFSARMMTVK